MVTQQLTTCDIILTKSIKIYFDQTPTRNMAAIITMSTNNHPTPQMKGQGGTQDKLCNLCNRTINRLIRGVRREDAMQATL